MIAEDLERLAERGPHRDPSVVVASALAESDVTRARSRRGSTVAIAAVSVTLIAGVAVAVAIRAGVDDDQTEAVDGASGDEPADPLAGLSDDDWVAPGALPAGYEVIVAMTAGGSEPTDGQILVGGDDVDEVRISARSATSQEVEGVMEEEATVGDDPGVPVETVDIAGIEWLAQSVIDDDGVDWGNYLQRDVNDRRVLLTTRGDPDTLIEIAAGLRPITDGELDAPRLSPDSGTYLPVTSLDDVDVTAHGVNGVYCLNIDVPDGTSARSCGARTEPGTPVVDSVGLGSQDGSYAAGVAESDVVRIEFVPDDGASVVVVPTDESESFDHRFWVTDKPAATHGRAIVTYDDGATVTLQRGGPGHWEMIDDTRTDGAAAEAEAEADAEADASPAESTPPTVATPDSPPWDFTFSSLDGLVAIDIPHVVDYPVNGEALTVWTTGGGVVDGYLTLRDVPRGPSTSPEGDVMATRIDAPTGEAWLVVDNVEPPAPSSATRVMWWRDDGRLWIVSNHNLTTQSLPELAFGIEVGPDGSYTLTDPDMSFVGTTRSEALESMTQAWTLDGHNVILSVTNGGLAQALGDWPVDNVVEQTVAGMPGYALTLTNGQVVLLWPTDHPDWWMSMTSEPLLASRTNDLAAVIVRS